MTPPETRNHTPVSPEHHNADEPEENDLKNIFRKMIEDLKEDMRKFLKEMEENNADEPEENDLKNIFRKMIEDLKEDMRIP